MRDSDRECPASKRRRERQNTFVFTQLPPAHPPNHIHLSVDLKEHQSNLPIRAPEKGYRTSKKRVEQEAKKRGPKKQKKNTYSIRDHHDISPTSLPVAFLMQADLPQVRRAHTRTVAENEIRNGRRDLAGRRAGAAEAAHRGVAADRLAVIVGTVAAGAAVGARASGRRTRDDLPAVGRSDDNGTGRSGGRWVWAVRAEERMDICIVNVCRGAGARGVWAVGHESRCRRRQILEI